MKTKVIHNLSKIGVSSLPVENVQELSSKNLKDIPYRYIRPELSSDEVLVNDSSQIPVIDMSKLVAGNVGYRTEMSKLHQACKDWGFFQLTNHGAKTEIENMKAAIQDFFKLPLEEKMVYAQRPGSLEGYGQAFVMSEDQKLDWNDTIVIFSLPESGRNMSFWPNNPSSFRSSLEEYSHELHRIFIILCESMATNLGVEFQEIANMYVECTQAIRMTYYPPCSQADKVIGFSPHSDSSILTLLVQVNEVAGLQIHRSGKWIPINPLPGAIIVNIGDAMEIMSNGEYRSIEHRAMVNFQKERISIAAFQNPSVASTIGPLPDLVRVNGARYRAVKFEDYMKQFLGNRLDGKSTLDSVKIYNREINSTV